MKNSEPILKTLFIKLSKLEYLVSFIINVIDKSNFNKKADIHRPSFLSHNYSNSRLLSSRLSCTAFKPFVCRPQLCPSISIYPYPSILQPSRLSSASLGVRILFQGQTDILYPPSTSPQAQGLQPRGVLPFYIHSGCRACARDPSSAPAASLLNLPITHSSVIDS